MREDVGSVERLVVAATAANPDQLIESVLRGDDSPFPADADSEFEESVLRSSAVHGVDALLHYLLSANNASDSWPLHVWERMGRLAIVHSARELAVKSELMDVLRRFRDAGVELLLLKGAPLAYLYYQHPYLRTRGDTDIFVAEEDRRLAGDLLLEAGYEAEEDRACALAAYQRTYSGTGKAGGDHVVDLHWRLCNDQLFARLFSFKELYDAAVAVPELGPGARTPSAVHALLIACMHRVLHRTSPYFVSGIPHLEANRLIWLYDIHVLASRSSNAEWVQFVDLAVGKGLRAVCLDGLRNTETHLGTRFPEDVIAQLVAPGPDELASQYLKPGLWRCKLVDLQALPSWGQRRRLVTEWVFPSADYMLAAYGVRSRWLLPLLYLRRTSELIRRLFRFSAA